MNAPVKQTAPAPNAPGAAPPPRRPYVGARVYYYDVERPREFNTMGSGPYAAVVVQVLKNEASGGVNLECGLMVLSDQGAQNHHKVPHVSQREELRAKRYWDWMPRELD